MKLATYNVENMFKRAKAFNGEDWSDGRPALEAHRELNDLFNKPVYSAGDKKRMLALLKAQGLLKKDDGGRYLILRTIRGKLLMRPRSGSVSVVADGRGDWIGWVELKTEAVREAATENIARVMDAVGADVLGLVEAEDRTTLCLFNKHVFAGLDLPRYEHIMLIDGNDERGIDVGILTRGNHPIQSIRSHVDARDATGLVFSRDCAEYEIRTPASCGIERRGMWGGTKGTLWPHFPQVKSEKDVASDHAALWVDVNI